MLTAESALRFCPYTLSLLLSLLLCLCQERGVSAIPIENSLLGPPNIRCGSASIQVDFETENDFEGKIYVKGLSGSDGCIIREDSSIEIGVGDCGMSRLRSLSPQRGVTMVMTLILSFHPKFITKIDRAFNIQCFYMEADKTVDTPLIVSMLTTVFVEALPPVMPQCTYQLLEGGPDGDEIEFATVGTKVYHKWNCEANQGCCYVEDAGRSGRVSLIDSDGCSIDKHLLDNIEYTQDLMAGVEEPNSECIRPVCPDPGRAFQLSRAAVEREVFQEASSSSGSRGISEEIEIVREDLIPLTGGNQQEISLAAVAVAGGDEEEFGSGEQPEQDFGSGQEIEILDPLSSNNGSDAIKARRRKREAIVAGESDLRAELYALELSAFEWERNSFLERWLIASSSSTSPGLYNAHCFSIHSIILSVMFLSVILLSVPLIAFLRCTKFY